MLLATGAGAAFTQTWNVWLQEHDDDDTAANQENKKTLQPQVAEQTYDLGESGHSSGCWGQ